MQTLSGSNETSPIRALHAQCQRSRTKIPACTRNSLCQAAPARAQIAYPFARVIGLGASGSAILSESAAAVPKIPLAISEDSLLRRTM